MPNESKVYEELLQRVHRASDRDQVLKVMDEYYDLRGWDKETGHPKIDTIERLGLGFCKPDKG